MSQKRRGFVSISHWFFYLAVLLLLVSCSVNTEITQPTTSVNDSAKPLLEIHAAPGQIRLNEPFSVMLNVKNALPNAQLDITLAGVAGIVPSQNSITLKTNPQGHANGKITATVSERHHTSLIARTEFGGENLSNSLDIVFDSKGTRSAARKVGATVSLGKEIDIQAYFAAMPRTSDSNYVMNYERDKHRVNASGLSTLIEDTTADVPDTLIVENITYQMPDGTESEPFSGVEYYLSDTGSGEPTPEQIEGTDIGGLTTQACSSNIVFTTFKQSIDGVMEFMPKGTYVRAVDYNGIWPDRIIEEWYISDYGRFYYDLPTCDTAGGSTPPDIYFIFETRTQKNVNGSSVGDGLTATHGTIARRHWWLTGTYYDVTPTSRPVGVAVSVVGVNAEARNTQRLWHKINQVRNWERAQVTPFSFPVDILYPVSTYVGIAPLSRAFIGQVQVVYDQALDDDILFHEYGHEVYYRRTMGQVNYNFGYNCNFAATCFSPPLCGGCLWHDGSKNIGPEAAMIEGWADFFEAVALYNIPNNNGGATYYVVEDPRCCTWNNKPVASGVGAEFRVAAYLWDLYDGIDSFEPVDQIDGLGNYKKIAAYMNQPSWAESSELKQIWLENIEPSLNADLQEKHCRLMIYNTLGILCR
jgi:hypothetical protein